VSQRSRLGLTLVHPRVVQSRLLLLQGPSGAEALARSLVRRRKEVAKQTPAAGKRQESRACCATEMTPWPRPKLWPEA